MKCVIVGIGNPNLCDDALGIRVIEEIEKLNLNADTFALFMGDFDVLDKILGYDLAIIVDAIRLGNEPGTIYEFSHDEFSFIPFSGTHGMNLITTLRVGMEVFGEEMPGDIRIIAVEVEDVESFGRDCTPKVKAAIPKVVERITEIVAGSNCCLDQIAAESRQK
ncbi:hydrogenase maturation protease [Archaeoglobus sulfaticallidus PM70-1]|uniref:Hydrogenase maturation protease n=1 Tax=Archaeoglobus sulfaticallidus PM70-1 TaxID=387631 RepID=N0BKP0_9EURY|nr:hydrogenase maturation protease [Archaeoglobus sulfaticallidus]AGK61076.1 hydrogenase maturation protease [Archaeoglobus sulfaticallidus PM70-1]